MTTQALKDTELKPETILLICSPYLALTGKTSIWEAAAAAVVNAVELLVNPDLTCPDLKTSEGLYNSLEDEDEARKLRRQAMDSGITAEVLVAPLRLEAGMTQPPEWGNRLLRKARSAGAHQISFPLVTDNFIEPEISDRDYTDSALRVFSGLVATSQKEGVKILFENLSVYLNRPEILERILAEFSREELGLCLDPVNLCWYGHPADEVYQIAEKLASRATGLHIKNIHYPGDAFNTRRQPGWKYDESAVPAEQGDLDFKRIINQFRESGFTGYFGLEDDSLNLVPVEQRMAILRTSVAFVKSRLDS